MNYDQVTLPTQLNREENRMSKYLFKFFGGIILVALLFIHDNSGAAAAQITRKLDNDTKIIPTGFIVATSKEIPKFKKGTDVTLNMYGEVIEGILAEDIELPYETGAPQNQVKPTMTYVPATVVVIPSYLEAPKNRVLPFKGDTKVTFNERGEVIRGTLTGSDHNIILSPTNHITVRSGEISFHKNGMPARCTLESDTYLRPVGWSQILAENVTDSMVCPGFVEFKASHPILLNEKGEVIKGTLNQDTKLRSFLLINIGIAEVQSFQAGTTVEFDENGVATKAAK